MNTTSYDWTDSFGEFFNGYSNDDADSKTVTLLCCDSYLLLHDLEISIFEEVQNYNNSAPSCNLKSLDGKSCFKKESQILSSEEDLFARLSNLDLQESSESMSRESQDDIFDELSNSDLLEFAIRQLQNLSKAETMRSSLPPLLLTIQQATKKVWKYVSNYALSSLIPRFHNKDISAKIKAQFGPEAYLWQISVVTNISHYIKDVFVIAGTNTKKSLTYQSISEITGGIVLVISLTIAFIEDET